MFKETNRIRLSFLLAFLSACAFHCTAQSETITSGLSVYIPSFEERFDWSFNYGGNDGGSSLEDYTHETLKRENTSFHFSSLERIWKLQHKEERKWLIH